MPDAGGRSEVSPSPLVSLSRQSQRVTSPMLQGRDTDIIRFCIAGQGDDWNSAVNLPRFPIRLPDGKLVLGPLPIGNPLCPLHVPGPRLAPLHLTASVLGLGPGKLVHLTTAPRLAASGPAGRLRARILHPSSKCRPHDERSVGCRNCRTPRPGSPKAFRCFRIATIGLRPRRLAVARWPTCGGNGLRGPG